MNRRKLETLLLTLESTPALIEKAARTLAPRDETRRPAAGGFSFLENVWHLADLEREAYRVRIRRLLTEEEPSLANFDGDRAARERDYQRRSLAEGLVAFSLARQRNVERLRALSGGAWKRAGYQESVGRVTLADVPRMMAEHDRSHTEDLRALLEEFRCGAPTLPCPRPTSAVA
jgi:DinB superfamily